jgi:hypothetical protein
MKSIVVRTTAFVVGSLIAGCVYASHDGSAAQGAIPVPHIAVYPGARATVGDPNGDKADVTLHLTVVQLRMIAARYTTADPQAKVVDFYRRSLASLGAVKVADSGPHAQIEGFKWTNEPGEETVVAGTSFVAVERIGGRTEFGIFSIVPRH